MLVSKEPARASRSDGLAGVRFLVKALVIVSFLLLLTGYNYYVKGEVPNLWSSGEGFSLVSDEFVSLTSRQLKEEGQVRLTFPNDVFFAVGGDVSALYLVKWCR